MAELDVNKSAFSSCYERLEALSSGLMIMPTFSEDAAGDTSMTGEKERQCYDELLEIIGDLISLADETAQDLKLTQARYVLADQ